MADIFEKLKVLNKSLQMKDTNILKWIEKIQSFVKKLSLYKSGIKSHNFEIFPNLQTTIGELHQNTIPPSEKKYFVNHTNILKSRLIDYFY